MLANCDAVVVVVVVVDDDVAVVGLAVALDTLDECLFANVVVSLLCAVRVGDGDGVDR